MEKTKNKQQPKTFWQYLVDEYILFRRDFLYEPQVAPEIVAEKLDYQDYDNNSFWVKERRVQAHVVKVADEWHFELLAEQPVRNRRYAIDYVQQRYSLSARAEGKIYSDEDGKTLLEGTVVVGGWQFWASVLVFSLFIFFIFFQFFGSFFSWFGVIYLLAMVYAWFQMYQDRNHLVSLIEQAVASANERIYG